MTNAYSPLIAGLAFAAIFFPGCSENKPAETKTTSTATEKSSFGGYESQVKWGEHLVAIGGCNDCHTPKKMTAMGPVDDSTLMLSGHPEQLPAPEVDRKATESKFVYALRNMVSKGLPGSRPLMPPMSMMPVKNMTDDELKAIYAYLRTIKPIKNRSVQPTPP